MSVESIVIKGLAGSLILLKVKGPEGGASGTLTSYPSYPSVANGFTPIERSRVSPAVESDKVRFHGDEKMVLVPISTINTENTKRIRRDFLMLSLPLSI